MPTNLQFLTHLLAAAAGRIRHIRQRALLLLCLMALAANASAASPTMPSFFARRDYTGLNSYWVQIADTNGDGIPDLIANWTGAIEVLFGNGDGTFGPAGATTLTVSGAYTFVTADLNHDGKVDLVLAGSTNTGGGMTVCMGNGDGTFQAGTFYGGPGSTGSDLGSLVLGDFNGDGIPDVAAAGTGGVWLFTGKGGGIFNPGVLAVSLPTGGAFIATADFNGDHKPDLAVTMPDSGFAVLLGNGDGTFQAPTTFIEPYMPGGLAVGPLTKGGHPGIVLSANSAFYLYSGNGAGGFSGPHVLSLPVQSPIALGDVNGDGFPDLVSASGYIAFGTASGAFKPAVHHTVANVFNQFENVVLADLRKNGLTDIVTDDPTGISVLLNVGKGKFEDGEWTAVTGGAGCGATADFNGDGKPDLAVTTNTGFTILLGTGKVTVPFTAGASVAVAGAACLITGDLNGDGIPDLLVSVNGSPNALLAYLGNGDGTFTLKSTTPTPNSGGYVALADFNHDGKLDFATSGNLLALGNGDGTFQTPAPFVPNPPSSGFSGIAAGDINNDGWPDLVLTNSYLFSPGVDVYVLLNNQQGGFNQVPTSFGVGTQQPILADLNGDGNLDLVLASVQGSAASVYIGNGTGAFTTGPLLQGPGGPGTGIDLVADVNGDGIPDVLVSGGDTIEVYLGQGSATYAAPFAIGTGPVPGSLLAENLHGQPPSAGLPDIVIPDYSGGVTVLINKTK